ncbi:GIY-YIG catalytic domain-containing endonuclease [Paramecium bursaria Chlorella virus Fr5L]|nr:GIY-YIG catalytic domain-containing endonuclease [Paramecium bursaria Chlorella virus Fr5L]
MKLEKKMSEANKGEKHHMYGKKHSEEYKKKMSEAAKKGENSPWYGKKHTEETKQKISEAFSKKVFQYTLDGELLQSFASSGKAAQTLGKSDGSAISKCACGKLHTAHGFKWSYVLH